MKKKIEDSRKKNNCENVKINKYPFFLHSTRTLFPFLKISLEEFDR